MKKLLFLNLLMACLLSFTACGGDDEPEDMDTELPAVSLEVNYMGNTFTVTDADMIDADISNSTVNGTKVRHWSGEATLNDTLNLEFFVQNIRDQEEDGNVRIRTYDCSEEDCETQDGIEVCEEGKANLRATTGNSIRTDLSSPVGTFTVTSNDPTKRIMSGNFLLQVRRFGTLDDFTPLEGNFENIHYGSF